jgi:protein O-GlcNAc transferase
VSTLLSVADLFQSGCDRHIAGRPDEARAIYLQVLAIDPGHADCHANLGDLFGQAGRLTEAEPHYRAALALNPNLPRALSNLGHILNRSGRSAEAERLCRRAVQLRPDYVAALNNLAVALTILGRLDEAEAHYRQSLGLKPDIGVLRDLGNLLSACRRPEQAIACYRDALRLKPDDAWSHSGLGDIFLNAHRHVEAAQCYRDALRLDASLIDARHRLGLMLGHLGRQHEAIACYDEILRRHPDFVPARVDRCLARLPVIYRDEAEVERARAAYAEDLMTLCALPADTIGLDAVSGMPPFYLAHQGRVNRGLQARYGGFVHAVMTAHYPAWSVPPQVAPPRSGERIRVGFLSAYFYNHSNWKIRLHGWITGLDPDRFQIFGYHLGDLADDETAIAARHCHRFVQGLGTIGAWAETILADRLHVLMIPGIGMDATTHQLAALRLAPVQATSWSHPDTTGLPSIDHYLTSALMEPDNADEHYTERLVRLPNLGVAYLPLRLEPATISRAELGVAEDAVFYWCCQSLFKYLPRHDWIFPHIAAAVPQAQFLFIELGWDEAVTTVFRERLNRAFAAAGLDAARHCRFAPSLSMARFGAVGRVADIFLDSLGWAGCNTTLEALASDLPVVTMAGELMRGRHGAAILTLLGMTDMIAQTEEAFVDLAVALGRDPMKRQELRARIARDKHRLYRDQTAIDGLSRYLEDAARNPALVAADYSV